MDRWLVVSLVRSQGTKLFDFGATPGYIYSKPIKDSTVIIQFKGPRLGSKTQPDRAQLWQFPLTPPSHVNLTSSSLPSYPREFVCSLMGHMITLPTVMGAPTTSSFVMSNCLSASTLLTYIHFQRITSVHSQVII